MKSFILNHRKRFLQGFAIYQIVGGIAGILMLYFLYWSQGAAVIVGTMFVIAPFVALYLISIYAGYCYFKGRMTRFYVLTFFLLWLQVFQFTIPGFKFGFYYGPYLAIGTNSDLQFFMNFNTLTVNFNIALMSPTGFALMINFIPVAFLSIISLIKNAPEPDPLPVGFLQEEFLG
ncbi:MAG TPA: hypothetical protein VFZ47_03720 [Chitinophagaceae bacterium]